MKQLLPPSLQGETITSALVGALRVHAELVSSTVGSLCATLVNVCREDARVGISIPILLTGKLEASIFGEWTWPGLNGVAETAGCPPPQMQRCSQTLGCPATDYVFQSALQLGSVAL